MRVPPLLLAGLALVALASVALVLPRAEVPALKDLGAGTLPPPPELRLLTPSPGDGVGGRVLLSGEVASTGREVSDVHVRVDGGRWESIPLARRGEAATPFAIELPLPPGDHLLEARAYDGQALSLVGGALVRRDAPTVRILHPLDGEGVRAGELLVSGTARGGAERVLVDVGDTTYASTLAEDGAWSVAVQIPAGEQLLRARALGALASLPHELRLAAGAPAPPTIAILAPRADASYGSLGDPSCELGACILVAGTAASAQRVEVHLDGQALGNASVAAGAWRFPIRMSALANGSHELAARGWDAQGRPGALRAQRLLARAPAGLEIHGAEASEPTLTPLELFALGPGAEGASWTLDGEPLGEGSTVGLMLATPGDHVVSAHAALPDGRSASVSRTLHARNRPPDLTLGEPLQVGADVRFLANATDLDGVLVEHRWDFGDGNASRTQDASAVHRYAERGAYEATLTVVDDRGAATSASVPVLVANAAPLVAFDWTPENPSILDVVTLRDLTVDADGLLVGRQWRFPDGNTSENATPTLRLRTRGPHAVTLTAVDELGLEASLTRTLHVVNLPPAVDLTFAPAFPLTHQEVLFADATLDPDGPLARWSWDFGDGGAAEGRATVHAFRAPGNYTVRLTVMDDLGAVANVTREVRVADSAPEVSGVTVEPPHPKAQEEVRLRVVATDREGSVIPTHWAFGDGAEANESEPTHRYPTSGLFHGNVTLLDTGGITVVYPFLVRVENAPPLATLSTAPGGRIAAYPTHFLADATDPGGRIALYRFDPDGDGRFDCESVEPSCAFVFETPGSYGARLIVEDDEGAAAEAGLLVDVTPPPSSLAPPRVRVESPLRDARLKGDHLMRGEASGVREVVKVELQFRTPTFSYSGARDAWRLTSGAREWHALVDTRALRDGQYELVVRATDTGGGVGYARVPVLVQNGPRPSDVTLHLVDAPELVEEDALIRGSAFHPDGVTSVRWRVDEEDWRVETESPLAFTIELERDLLKPGMHVLRVEAYRGVGESANLTHAFQVPGVAPALVVDEPPGPVAHALLRAAGRVVGEGRAQWRLDHGVWRDLPPGEAWNLSEDTLDVVGGAHVLSLRAVSPDGRLASEPIRYDVSIVNPPFFPEQPRPPPDPRADAPLPWVLALGTAVAVARAIRRPRERS